MRDRNKNWKWFFLCIGLLMIVASASGESKEYQIAALNYHNEKRKEHQVGPLVLDAKLNDLADQCAKYYVVNRTTIDHSCPHKAGAGENLYWGGGGSTDLTVQSEKASQMWYEEVGQYDFAKPGFGMNTGHFTAMVWKASTKLGIGAYSEGGSTVVAALYDPHPNVQRGFQENVLPKATGASGSGTGTSGSGTGTSGTGTSGSGTGTSGSGTGTSGSGTETGRHEENASPKASTSNVNNLTSQLLTLIISCCLYLIRLQHE